MFAAYTRKKGKLTSEETSGRSVDLLSGDEGSNEGDKSDGGELEHD